MCERTSSAETIKTAKLSRTRIAKYSPPNHLDFPGKEIVTVCQAVDLALTSQKSGIKTVLAKSPDTRATHTSIVVKLSSCVGLGKDDLERIRSVMVNVLTFAFAF